MSRIALDLGTATTRLAIGAEPPHALESLAAIDVERGDVIAVGSAARAVVLREGGRTSLVHVVDAGVPVGPQVLAGFLKRTLREVGLRSLGHGEVVMSMSELATSVERRMAARLIDRLGASAVTLVPPSLSVLRAVGADPEFGSFAMVVGEAYTEAGIAAMGSLCASAASKDGVRDLRRAIREYLWSNHELAISDETASEVLTQLCDVSRPTQSARARIWGRRRTDAESTNVIVDASALVAAMTPTLRSIEQLANTALARAHAQLVADIAERGLVLAGGGSYVPGLAARLANALKIPVTVADEPLDAVLRGLRTSARLPRRRSPAPS
ncbi:actin-like ATPase involved in cell morphogenesis [Acidimicrobium ferrooxidans DSM 10331]|uniref:Actin-like ATPase involved in cell morphogenesis n=1 Tax=Acidimicrobium ferrooxidans (strain DSM 10331 / JCM 15462 / NBRC 103882 / ICP) TaxID=525909 RepID=C7M1Q0_ACIFD|nr:rod shape-determining protein [Acidimicrobium ferrooxidans]ACU54797.1 actin-like ATPase involved in cell morphogenesis [Acidimicrobium ferrooxidans DSM 10331]